LLAQLSLVQRGSGAAVSTLELSPGERVDLRVVLQTKPGCPARGDDVVWGLVEVECPGEDVERVAVCGRALGDAVFRASQQRLVLVVGREDEAFTLFNDLAQDAVVALTFKQGDVAAVVPSRATSMDGGDVRVSALSALDVLVTALRPGEDTLVA